LNVALVVEVGVVKPFFTEWHVLGVNPHRPGTPRRVHSFAYEVNFFELGSAILRLAQIA